VVHFLLVVKGSLTQLQGNIYQPLLYGSIAVLLLILRISKIKLALVGLRNRFESWKQNPHPASPVDK
jgi:DMSO/TMAO reductase YedYZ heme-binding membrane subunit